MREVSSINVGVWAFFDFISGCVSDTVHLVEACVSPLTINEVGSL